MLWGESWTNLIINKQNKGLSTTEDGIMMVIDFSGRFNGEAFVQFGSNEDALKALDRHKQKISNRLVLV